MFQRWVGVSVRDSKQFYFLKKRKSEICLEGGSGFPSSGYQTIFFKKEKFLIFKTHLGRGNSFRRWLGV
jgi:hypothetical protein